MTTTTTTETKAVKFSWTEENTATVVNAYKAKLESDGSEVASSNDYLLELAQMVGAASEKSIRGKLSREGVYVKLDKPASQPKTNKVRKEHLVRAIANTLAVDPDDLDSLKNGKQDHLQLLADKLGITDVMAAAKTGYEIEPENMILNMVKANDIDHESLYDALSELEAE